MALKLTKGQREELKQLFGGRCAYCGVTLGKVWHADHVEAVYRGYTLGGKGHKHPERDTIANLFPACAPCNLDKSVWSVEKWRVRLQEKLAVLKAHSNPYRHALRFGLVTENQEPVVFWFEKMKRPDVQSIANTI